MMDFCSSVKTVIKFSKHSMPIVSTMHQLRMLRNVKKPLRQFVLDDCSALEPAIKKILVKVKKQLCEHKVFTS